MEANSSSPPRPLLVTILAILTIVGVIGGFCYEGLKAVVPELGRNEVPLPAWITISGYVLAVGKILAATLLLQMRRLGFYLYATFESILAVFSIIGGKIGMDYLDRGYYDPSIPVDPKVLMIFVVGMGLGLTIAFIGGYSSHLSKMR